MFGALAGIVLDIAGVTIVDTQVAKALLQSAQALRLLGCTVTITGISSIVATTLTHLGIALDGSKSHARLKLCCYE
ncbi:MAG: STAS domain-containing protein [Kouleothrix sp.]